MWAFSRFDKSGAQKDSRILGADGPVSSTNLHHEHEPKMPPDQRPNRDDDPRLQLGAYITDGVALVEVVGGRLTYGVFGPWHAVCVEDCLTLQIGEYSADAIRRRFRLVRVGPLRADEMSVALERDAA
jgi:hypothetical protein